MGLFQKNNSIFSNFKYVSKNEEEYLINIEYGCFDILSSHKLLDDIFESIKIDYIDKIVWENYLNKKHENDLRENGKAYIIKKPEYKVLGKNAKFNSKVKRKFQAPQNDNLQELYKSGEYIGYQKSCKVILYDCYFDNEDEYLITLLNIILNCNMHFVIRKCNICKKYYISNSNKLKNCNRIYKTNLTCREYANDLNKNISKNNILKKLIKNVRDNYKKDYNLIQDFNDALKDKRKETTNNEDEIIKWILATYYKSEKTRNNAIKRLDLSYLFD